MLSFFSNNLKGKKVKKFVFFVCCLVINFYASNLYASYDFDPLEPINRAVFNFNNQFDKYVSHPVTRGYRAVTTPQIRNSVHLFLQNLGELLSAANHLLQLQPGAAIKSVGRVAINSTLGIGGLFDVAGGWGLKYEGTSIDETLAYYCVPEGPYLVLPFLGPSTLRTATSTVATAYLEPLVLAARNIDSDGDKNTLLYSYAALTWLDARNQTYDLLMDLEQNSVDFYANLKTTYLQNKAKAKSLCKNNKDTQQSYDFDFDFEDDANMDME